MSDQPATTNDGQAGVISRLGGPFLCVLTLIVVALSAVAVAFDKASFMQACWAVALFLGLHSSVSTILQKLGNTGDRIGDLASSTARLAGREGNASLTAAALQSVIDKSQTALKQLNAGLAENTRLTRGIHTEVVAPQSKGKK